MDFLLQEPSICSARRQIGTQQKTERTNAMNAATYCSVARLTAESDRFLAKIEIAIGILTRGKQTLEDLWSKGVINEMEYSNQLSMILAKAKDVLDQLGETSDLNGRFTSVLN